jgi:O-methyltransferase
MLYPHSLLGPIDTRELYLDLMKRALLNWLYLPKERNIYPIERTSGAKGILLRLLRRRGMGLHYRRADSTPGERLEGRDWPFAAHTMTGLARLDVLQWCAECVLNQGIPGDFLETGVWRGGSTIFMRAVLKAYQETSRRVWVCDSFEGLPRPDTTRYPKEGTTDFYQWNQHLAISLEEVKDNFNRYGLLDEQVCFLKGWFDDTLPSAPVERLALLRLDGDMYGSTWVALDSLYPKLSAGGFVIIDDYAIPECRRAVDDYRAGHGIDERVVPTNDGMGAYWRAAPALQTG